MTHQVEWTPEERERAKTILNSDARALNTESKNPTVTPDTCREWRKRMHTEDVTPRGMPARGYSASTVRKHITGRCQHTQGCVWEYVDGDWQTVE